MLKAPAAASGSAPLSQRASRTQKALEQFLSEPQDPSSPNYHKWLTPEQFAVVQINYRIPSGVQSGVRPVVVRVGNGFSAAAYLTVTQ